MQPKYLSRYLPLRGIRSALGGISERAKRVAFGYTFDDTFDGALASIFVHVEGTVDRRAGR